LIATFCQQSKIFDPPSVIINFVKYSAFGILTKQSLIVMIVIGPMGAFLSYFVTLPLSFLPESVLTKLNCGSKKPMDLSNKMKHSVACEVGNQNAVLRFDRQTLTLKL
jgi:hypothetical protein